MKKYRNDLLAAFLLTCIVMLPYITGSFLPIEHDTFFHVSRIEHLSRSIASGNFIPSVYPDENAGFGYGSPLFYSDFFLIIPALMHLCGLSLVRTYQFTVFAATFAGAFMMILAAGTVTKKKSTAYLSAAAYLFSNYHITDIYVRGALGEIFALAFLPGLLAGIHELMFAGHREKKHLFILSLAALALCHNLTFLLASILTAVCFCIQIFRMEKEDIVTVCTSVFTAFLLTVFFTLPMLEQTSAQKLILHYYGSSSDLGKYAMDFWQYFANRTVFGLAGNDLARDRTMLENIGYFLTFIPLLYLLPGVRKTRFMNTLFILGYICFLLPSSLVPWSSLRMFSILQFPWRINTLTILLLSIPAAYSFCSLLSGRLPAVAVIFLLAGECLWHVIPVYQRTFGMTADMTWNDVLDGALCDPYYSAYYVRVELAGGDYLPVTSPDFRGRQRKILSDEITADIPFRERYGVLSFTLDSQKGRIHLPLTWYKGYMVYRTQGTKMTLMNTGPDEEGMVSFLPDGEGSYMCLYQDTFVKRMCTSISVISLTLLWLEYVKQRHMKKS